LTGTPPWAFLGGQGAASLPRASSGRRAINRISPDLAEIEQLRRQAPEGPVVIINLMKFKPGAEGMAAYQRYLDSARDPGLPVEVIHAGPAFADVCDTGEQWDYAIVARWPSFAAFADGISSPRWQAAAAHRPAALERTLMVVSPAGPLPAGTSGTAEQETDR